MKVLIVAKTRRGGGACVGGITGEGRSVRLIARDAARNERAGLEYEVGEVWEVDAVADPHLIPPHVENMIVQRARRLRRSLKVAATIHRFMAPVAGGPEKLFDGLAQATASGGLYIAQRTGLPRRSTMFWVPDQPLRLDCEGKRLRYRYPTRDDGRTLTFVGFQEPLREIPAGTLLRVSLAHWWRPNERPEEELRCFVQLSGWFLEPGTVPGCKLTEGEVSSAEARGAGLSMPDTRPVPGRSRERPGGGQEPFRRAQARAMAGEPGSAGAATRPAALQPRAWDVLKRTFGFSEFLPVQGEVIARILRREDALVVMPTGGGKSLCYQLPALLFEGLTVVVSPLVALMQDQVSQLGQVGVSAACLNHMVSLHEHMAIANRVRHGQTKLLYVAPETLLRPETLVLLEQSRLACLAIDEAHCISEWGHDFRPEYRQLQGVRRRFPQAVCLALTATATPRVREDIRCLLGLAAEGEFVASFNRQNLFLGVEPRRDGLAQVLAFLEKRRGQCGIVYCGTRRQADELCAALNANGWPALPYHAGLEDAVRRRNQERFIQDDGSLMVATVAFGMGINKADVRFVIHASLPKDLESYYQEIGRAGRDGLRADCLLLYSRGDAMVHRHFIEGGAESERPGREARLQALMRFAEARGCRRQPLLAYFGETLGQPCGHCDNCVQPSASGETTDATAAAQKFLGCVKVTGQIFGPGHIIGVLRGSQAERVLSRRHDRLSVFGTGKEHSTEQWRTLAQQFIRLGVVEQDFEFGGLRLTPKGWAVLQGKEKVQVPLERAPVTAAPAASSERHDPELFERLRKVRKELADQARVPAYVIFSDRTLLEMATSFPQDEAQLLAINGVGQAKLANYGALFLQAIRSHGSPPALPAKSSDAGIASSAIIRPVTRRRFHDIGELFAAGQSVDQLAQRFKVTCETVIQNLYRFHESGGALDPERVLVASRLAEPERARVLSAFERLGCGRLTPVHEALSGAVPYKELHLLRLYFLCRGRKR